MNVAPGTYAIQGGGFLNDGDMSFVRIGNHGTGTITPYIDATSSDTTQDLQLDTVALSVNFVDQNNSPIANADISIGVGSGNTTFAVGHPGSVTVTPIGPQD